VANLCWDLGKYISLLITAILTHIYCAIYSTRLTCSFAHRMLTTRSHMPIQRVLAAAGVDLYARWERPTSSAEKLTLIMSEADEAKWMDARNQCLETLRVKKDFRRAGEAPCGVSMICEVPPENLSKLTVGAASSVSLTVDGGLECRQRQ
jgi:hypothetical protein